MKDIYHEVDMQVKLKLFRVEIRLNHFTWNHLLPSFEEILGLTAIE